MRAKKTHFSTINSTHNRQEKRMISLNLIPDPSEFPQWISKFSIGYSRIAEVEIRLRRAVQADLLILENVVRHRRKDFFHARDIYYFWCPGKKFALRLTWFINSSPHYLELIGNIEEARKFLFSRGV